MWKAIVDLLRRPIFAAIVGGLFFTLVCFAAFAFVYNAVRLDNNKLVSNFQSVEQSSVFAGTFLAFAIISIGFIYLLLRREGDDIYSVLRKKLVGNWSCNFESVLLKERGNFEVGTVVRTATIGIQPTTRKLSITFSQFESDLFSTRTFNLVGSAIDQRGDRYNLTIFGEYDQLVQPDIESISGRQEVVMPVLYSLHFYLDENEEVRTMEGLWFDLENVVVRMIEANLSNSATKERFKRYIDETRIVNPGLPLRWVRQPSTLEA
jgi:hypothetical protein